MGKIIIKAETLSNEDSDKIHLAVETARHAIEKVWEVMEMIWNQPGSKTERKQKVVTVWCDEQDSDIHLFREYLGVKGKSKLNGDNCISYREIKSVRKKIRWLRKKLLYKNLRFKLKDGDVIAYNLWFLSCIVLCPRFFTQNPLQRAATVIHELIHDFPIVHGKSIFNLKDYKKSFSIAEAKQMAILQPSKARKCAYNYEYLSREIISKYGIHSVISPTTL